MSHDPLGTAEEEQKRFAMLLSHYEAPASFRRGRAVEDALAQLFERCRQQFDDWLRLPRLFVGRLFALAGDPKRLLPLLADERQLLLLTQLEKQLAPKLRVPLEPTASTRELAAQFRQTVASLVRFNQRRERFLAQLDLAPLNQRIADYNRWYVLEKEFVVRSARLARHGFEPLPPITLATLEALFPPLPLPEAHGGAA